MCVVERHGRLSENAEHQVGLEGRLFRKQLVERRPIDVFHGDVSQIALLLHVVDGDDPRVGQDTGRASFPEQALAEAVRGSNANEVMSVGRDGSSDAIAFLDAGIPAVEFGPAGAGHHGPQEWVSIASLARYRRALGDFVLQLP